MPKARITKRFCDDAALPFGKGQECYWDIELRGFGLLVGKRSKTFIVQRSGRNRKKIGRYGLITVHQARDLARDRLAEMSVPGFIAPIRITLQDALELHIESMRRKACSQASIDAASERVHRHLSDWLDRKLSEITRSEVRERHSRIGQRAGPYAANYALRAFRAAYNTALKEHDLPQNPTIAVHWYKERRRQEPVKDLKAWYQTLRKVGNSVRRDYNLFVLFTGLRRVDAATVRWRDIDFQLETLHRPKPKGGVDRAFTIPLSRFILSILARRRDENQRLFPGSEWVFPTRKRDRSITYLREPRINGLPSPHRLRDTYHTACQEAGLSPYDIDVLTNHRPPLGSVSAGYIRQSDDHLKECQSRVTEHLSERTGINYLP